jgi:hypothetical protein
MVVSHRVLGKRLIDNMTFEGSEEGGENVIG